MKTLKRNNQITAEQIKDDRVVPGYYQVNETIFVGDKCYREGEVINLKWDGSEAFVTNSKKKSVRASQNEINEVSSTFCKTNKITVLEKRINRLEKKSGHWLKKISLFLKNNDHLMAHKITTGLLVPIYMAIIPFVCYGDTPAIRRGQVLEFVKTPFSKIYLFILATLYFLYILRRVLAEPLYRLADGLNEGRYEYEIKKIEKEIFDCGEPMIPVTGRKPLLMKPLVKETDTNQPLQKVFPDIPKVEIHEPEIKLEEHNGLFLYRTFWKGKKSRHRNAKRNNKEKKIS